MLNKKLVATSALAVTVAIPSIVFGAVAPKPAQGNTPAIGGPTTPAATATVKPTQESNLKKFKTSPASSVVATVNGEKITKGELDTILYDWYSPLALDEYINYRIVNQALKKEGLQVSKADVDKKIVEFQAAQFPGQNVDLVLQRMKWSRARFNSYISTMVAIEKITDKQIQPSPADYAEYVKASHILIRTAAAPSYNPEEKPKTDEEKAKMDADAKAKIEKIAAEIKAGKSFQDAAKEYSEDPGSKDTGGELGWFRKTDMVQQFSDAAFAMKAGQISEPVKTNFGYHLILVEQTGKDATPTEKAALRKQIVDRDRPTKMAAISQKMREQAKIDNKISPAVPDPQRPPGMSGASAPVRRAPATAPAAATKPNTAAKSVPPPPPAPPKPAGSNK
jgi:foldase protein PrsA